MNEYFENDWSHFWLPYKGQRNKIKVESKRYIKYMVTYLNDTNESVVFSNSIMWNIFFDTFFGELEVELSPLADLDKQFEHLHSNQTAKNNYTIVASSTCTEVDSSDCIVVVSSSTNFL